MSRLRRIIHVDMDAFYASVEQLDHPELRGKPVIVGGDPKSRGVVSAASYEVRPFGVHSAMPTAQALRLCPQAILVPGRMERYAEISQTIREIFESYTPLVEPISLDEAFLDVTDSENLFGPAETIGRAIKTRIREQTHLTASVGIATNKFLAKLASDLRKPDGFVVIPADNCQEVLDPLPVGRIWGVGKVTEKALHAWGIETIGQLRRRSMADLEQIVGNGAEELLQLAHGRDDREVEADRQCKSLSSEQTFATDVSNVEVLLSVLMEQVEEVAQRLRRHRLKARTITLKIRYGDFRTVTRSETLREGTNVTNLLWQTAERGFRQWHSRSGGPLRLLGFGVSGLEDERASQQLLFRDPQQEKLKKLDQIVDKIRDRYGRQAVRHGTAVPPDRPESSD